MPIYLGVPYTCDERSVRSYIDSTHSDNRSTGSDYLPALASIFDTGRTSALFDLVSVLSKTSANDRGRLLVKVLNARLSPYNI
jgi:hypothetical protein